MREVMPNVFSILKFQQGAPSWQSLQNTLCSVPVYKSSGNQVVGIGMSSPGGQSRNSRDTTDLELFNPTPGSCYNYIRPPHITSMLSTDTTRKGNV